jgi:hypothetical protein
MKEMAMAEFLMLALSNSIEGRADEYNDWYNNHHIPDLLSVPGMVSVQRWQVSGNPFLGPELEFGYLCVCEFEGDSVSATFDAISTAARGFDISTAIDFDGAQVVAFEPASPPVSAGK